MELSSSDSEEERHRQPRAAIVRGGIRPLPKNNLPSKGGRNELTQILVQNEDHSDDDEISAAPITFFGLNFTAFELDKR